MENALYVCFTEEVPDSIDQPCQVVDFDDGEPLVVADGKVKPAREVARRYSLHAERPKQYVPISLPLWAVWKREGDVPLVYPVIAFEVDSATTWRKRLIFVDEEGGYIVDERTAPNTFEPRSPDRLLYSPCRPSPLEVAALFARETLGEKGEGRAA